MFSPEVGVQEETSARLLLTAPDDEFVCAAALQEAARSAMKIVIAMGFLLINPYMLDPPGVCLNGGYIFRII
jgi:hypothetical protein